MELREVAAGELGAALEGATVIVDAIFGTGFSGEPRDPAASAIEAINSAPGLVVAADIASGVNAANGEVEGAARGGGTRPSRSTPRRSATGSRPARA